MGFDESTDLICVGAGAGGLTAAIVAAESGAEVIVLEKTAHLGGVTARSGGQIWAGANHLADSLGIPDSLEETKSYMEFLAGDLLDEARQAAYVPSVPAALRHLDQRSGLSLEVVRGFPDYWYPKAPGSKPEGRLLEVEPFDTRELGELEELLEVSPHGMAHFKTADLLTADGDQQVFGEIIGDHIAKHEVCSGTALGARLLRLAAELGVELRVESRVVGLVTDSAGRVAGAEVEGPSGRRSIGAKAVLLATGGYDWNESMVRAYEYLPGIRSMAQTSIEGDHIVMATRVGAAVATTLPEKNPIVVGFHTPGDTDDSGPVYRGVYNIGPHSMLVNRLGERFTDDSFYPAVGAAMSDFDCASGEFPNRPAWLIFDESFRQKSFVGPVPPNGPLPDGTAAIADTPAELATKLGVDPTGLEQTMIRFNEFCARGVDEDFGRGSKPWATTCWGDSRVEPNSVLGPLDTPPFYGIELTHVGVGLPSAGLRIDTVGRVVDAADQPIPGLYAAGNAAARLDTGGYQSGIANMRGLLYGYLVATDVLREAGTAADPIAAS